MTTRISHWIDGRLVEGASGRTGPVCDPATGQPTGVVELASIDEVGRAVESASAAAASWAQSSLSQRAGVLFGFRALLDAHRDELASVITAEHGKVLADAQGEVSRGLENVEFATAVPHLLKGDHSASVSTGVDVHSRRQPVGVVAGITPFNFPAMVALWMSPNAIACGNAFVLKPSEKDPSASLLLARLWQQAGLPDGVFNVVQGDRVAVDALIDHPDVAALSFVGSTPVAEHIHTAASARGKRVQALGGAKNHMVVLPDADLEVAADAAVSAGFGAAGERCMAISVVVAVGNVADPLVDAMAARVHKIRTGPGVDPDAEMGPLITAEHRERVRGYIASGAEDGAVVVVDGRESEVPADGWFLGPTLLDRVEPGMSVYTDEIFGPVLCVVRRPTYERAVELVNANQYANGTALFTRDGGVARRFESEVEVGMVGINVSIPVPVAAYSFGGWKRSLFGDTHMYGPEGINFYTRAKVVTSRWPDPTTSRVDLGFPTTR